MKAVNGSATISDFTYTYTKSGADTELAQTRVDAKAGLTTSYGYDARGELTSAVEKNGGGSTTAAWRYCYDNAGNRTHTSTSTSGTATCTTSPTTSYGYNTANELTSLNGSSTGWAYDGNGNETSGNSAIPRTSETYSASDQLLSGSASGTSFSATYAGLSNDERVTTTAGGVTDTYQNGPEGLAVEDCGCGATYYFTRDPGGTLASERDGSSHYYYVFDGLGSVVALVDSSGTVVETDSYDPFGQTRSSTGSVNNPFDYISGFDDGTGLHHLGARYYDPALGRFTQQDPAGQGPNLYAYTGDNPVNFVDPTGELTTGETVILVGAGIAFTGGIGLAGAGAIAGLVGVGELTTGLFAGATIVDLSAVGGIFLGAATSVVGGILSGFGI